MISDDINGFLNASATGYHVFENQKAFALADLKASTQDKSAIFFFGKNMALTQVPGNFMPDNKPAKGRRNDGICLDGT